jgi:hypothetical protein
MNPLTRLFSKQFHMVLQRENMEVMYYFDKIDIIIQKSLIRASFLITGMGQTHADVYLLKF